MTDNAYQPIFVIIRPCNVMPAAKIQPLQLRQPTAEPLFHRRYRNFQSIRILFTEGMEMKSIQEFQLLLLKVLQGCSKTRARRTGIVDCMTFLGGTFRVDAKADGFSGFFRL